MWRTGTYKLEGGNIKGGGNNDGLLHPNDATQRAGGGQHKGGPTLDKLSKFSSLPPINYWFLLNWFCPSMVNVIMLKISKNGINLQFRFTIVHFHRATLQNDWSYSTKPVIFLIYCVCAMRLFEWFLFWYFFCHKGQMLCREGWLHSRFVSLDQDVWPSPGSVYHRTWDRHGWHVLHQHLQASEPHIWQTVSPRGQCLSGQSWKATHCKSVN